jgi:DNA repair photolyase
MLSMPEVLIPVQAIKGRGAASQIAHRFTHDAREGFDDGWGTVDDLAVEQGERLPPATQVILEDAKSIINRGCEHGCIYCYARPTHSYLGYSPGLDFETKIVAKRNIAALLNSELARPSYTPHLLNIGSATDCYQPVERELQLTRQVLQVMRDRQHAFSLVTKSSGVERDIDLIAPMAACKLAAVYVTVTTLDAKLARILEPRAAAPHRRLRVIQTLAHAGIPVGVSVAPQIPFINEDMEQVLDAAWTAGARTAFYTVLRLPWELNPLFQEWLQQHYPQRAERVMARVREMRGGKDYDSDFATRMKGHGVWAQLIRTRFDKATQRLGFNRQRVELDLSAFKPPGGVQTVLF